MTHYLHIYCCIRVGNVIRRSQTVTWSLNDTLSITLDLNSMRSDVLSLNFVLSSFPASINISLWLNASLPAHQYYWHQTISFSRGLWGQETPQSELLSQRQRETALCLACDEKLVYLPPLMFSGWRPSQWQEEPLHSAVPSARELQS